MQIKAIETKYKGYRFRSRLEARWAVFMDSMKQKWIYEPEGYHLGSGLYLPDFYLPDNDMWMEIKPHKDDQKAFDKMFELCCLTNKIGVVCVGMPHEKQTFAFIGDIKESSGGVGWRNVNWCCCYYSHGIKLALSKDRFWCTPGWEPLKCIAQFPRPIRDEDYDAAKAARFEFGERGIK